MCFYTGCGPKWSAASMSSRTTSSRRYAPMHHGVSGADAGRVGDRVGTPPCQGLLERTTYAHHSHCYARIGLTGFPVSSFGVACHHSGMGLPAITVPVLTTPRLRLRPFRRQDAAWVYYISLDAELSRALSLPAPYTHALRGISSTRSRSGQHGMDKARTSSSRTRRRRSPWAGSACIAGTATRSHVDIGWPRTRAVAA